MMELKIQTKKYHQVVNITKRVEKFIKKEYKAVTVFSADTTVAITTTDKEKGTGSVLLQAIWEVVPKLHYKMPHNPTYLPAQIASSIIGSSKTIPVVNGKLAMGEWQKLIMLELDGPSTRKQIITTYS